MQLPVYRGRQGLRGLTYRWLDPVSWGPPGACGVRCLSCEAPGVVLVFA